MTPTKHRRIEIELAVDDDFVRFGSSANIPRPLHISRSKWRAFWQHFAAQGATIRSLLAAARMLSNNPDLTEADLCRRESRPKS